MELLHHSIRLLKHCQLSKEKLIQSNIPLPQEKIHASSVNCRITNTSGTGRLSAYNVSRTTPHFSGMLDGLIESDNRIFKGPFVLLALPFKKGTSGADNFPKIPLPFPPYRHQELASNRLKEQYSKSTIIVTGTGSEKTVSFL